ncbi:MAG: DMT family transporter [Limisphaerales bacterium]
MNSVLPVLLPLVAAMVYVVGALLAKRASAFGVGVWRTAFIANFISAALFALLLPFGGTFHLDLLWQPALVAVFYLIGQFLNFLALEQGDVSVATPVMGVKIILVAVCTTLLLTSGVTLKLWIAAGLSSLAIALLNRPDGTPHHHHVGRTILYAGSSAMMFAIFDVLVQKWSPGWGLGRFLPVMLGFTALFSVVFLPFFHAPLRGIPRAAWPWLLGGCGLIGLQSVVFVSTIARFGGATTANVIYSSRGLWSVMAVWAVGHWFSNREQHLGAAVLRWRLAGAVLMMAAIVLVLT